VSSANLESFLGIPFGTPGDDAKRILEQKPNCSFDDVNSDNDILFFNGIKFAGRETTFIVLYLFENKFSKASVFIKPKLEAQTIALYQEIKSEINSKYFISKKDYENYSSPYEKDDGHTETAISLGKASFSCFWSFKNDTQEDDYISLCINENMSITISYENGYLTGQRVKRDKENNMLDY
jgi:hypothetical protein